jgi:lipoprotein-releasing system ATP-binding protein
MSETALGARILAAEGLAKSYVMGPRTLEVLRGVSLEVREGEILAIQGPSGAGKSTLLHLLGLLDVPDRGRVFIRDVDALKLPSRERARYRNEKIGFVFQFYHLFKDLDALENVCLPRMVGLSFFAYRTRKRAIVERARELLGRVGLSGRLAHLPSQLSGGERQRVAIARALMNEPEIVLCDEPTGNLDQKTASEVLDLIWTLNAETHQTFVLVTHDETLARRAHRAIHVVDGAVAG